MDAAVSPYDDAWPGIENAQTDRCDRRRRMDATDAALDPEPTAVRNVLALVENPPLPNADRLLRRPTC